MADKKPFSLNKQTLRSRSAIVGYILLGLGAVELITGIVAPDFTAMWGDLFLLMSVIGVVGAVMTFFTLLAANPVFSGNSNLMGMAIGLTIAVLFMLTDRYWTILEPIKEFGIDSRFRFSAGQVLAVDYTNDPNLSTTHFSPKAHPAIEIIGIDNSTVNAYQGFPFSWGKYAKLLHALEGSQLSTIMFDIFFVDKKKDNYGLQELTTEISKRISGKDIAGNITITQADLARSSKFLSDAIKENKKVTVDYPFETLADPDFLKHPDTAARLRELSKYTIDNVIPTEHDRHHEWVDHPQPPILPIAEGVKGMGYANIRPDQGVNRKIPLVIKYQNKLYAGIDLIMAVEYFGVDLKKDVEIKLGDYIKIKNIPKKDVRYTSFLDGRPHVVQRDIMAKPNNNREISIPVDSEGFMDINFIGAPTQTFKGYPFVDLAEAERGAFGEEGRDPFIDKIVMVAIYYATGVAHDIHNSPFGPMAGIEHHANALNTILNQDFLYYVPAWVNYMIYLVLGLALGFAVPRYNMKKILLAVLVFAVLFIFEVFFVFNTFNIVHQYLIPFVSMVITLIAITGYKVLAEEENVKYIRSTFSKFVSKDVVNQLLANPDALELGGSKTEVTVFFSDIRGFTSISESLSPEDLVQLLNEYLSEMTEITLEFKGTIDKYMGDAIMAFWGAPVREEEHAYYACLAALKQLHFLGEMQAKWREEGRPVIDIGIGLNTGYAVVGNMGSAHRMDYTAMGDTINLGSRLEGTNKVYGTNIIISEFTYEKVKDKVVARELDLIRVKGKNEPVKIYELLDIADHEDFNRYKALEV